MNTHDYQHPSYEFPDSGQGNPIEEDNYFIENLFNEEGAFGESDCIGL